MYIYVSLQPYVYCAKPWWLDTGRSVHQRLSYSLYSEPAVFSADIWMGMLQMLLIYIFFVGSMSGGVMSFTADL